jgi:hypothetical protein
MGREWQSHINAIRTQRVKHKIGVIRASLQQRAAQNNVADKNDFSQVADDNRLFLEVDVLGRSMCALLDSGASMCVVGGPGMALMSELNLPSYKSKIKRVELADKSCNQVLGQVDLPITLSGKTFLIPALMVLTRAGPGTGRCASSAVVPVRGRRLRGLSLCLSLTWDVARGPTWCL